MSHIDEFGIKTGVLQVLKLKYEPPLSYCHIFFKRPPLKYVINRHILNKRTPPPSGDDVIYVQPLTCTYQV